MIYKFIFVNNKKLVKRFVKDEKVKKLKSMCDEVLDDIQNFVSIVTLGKLPPSHTASENNAPNPVK